MRMAREAYAYGKRGLCIWKKGPMHMAKEPYAYGKRGLFSEAYRRVHSKRGLCIWQERPMHMAKEAYAYGKRGLCIWQERRIFRGIAYRSVVGLDEALIPRTKEEVSERLPVRVPLGLHLL